MVAPSVDDIRTLVESARDEALLERPCRNIVVSHETSFSVSWPGQRLDVLALGLLSCVMGVAFRSRIALPLSAASLEHDAALPVNS